MAIQISDIIFHFIIKPGILLCLSTFSYNLEVNIKKLKFFKGEILYRQRNKPNFSRGSHARSCCGGQNHI